MDKGSYSDRRWSDNPMPVFSLCGKCKYWKGFGKCSMHEPIIPEVIFEKSFPGTEKYDEDYCPYRDMKEG